MAQGGQFGGLVAFSLEDLGQGDYRVAYQGIAQLIAGFDVEPFIELLTSGGVLIEGDINQDGQVDLLDVNPFVDLLISG